ncbi:MAG TPA: 50S ribosomal protein L10 [Cyclobacteriaceae bacterium]|nr:50S ribosomal protein L10 [Cyclobacteriaceae bacterium]
MTRDEKAQIIDELSEKFTQHNHFYVTDASGLSVEQINAFRRMCFNANVEYRVYKNTLIRKALEKNGNKNVEEIAKTLHGFSGVIFSKEAGSAPAKVIKEYRKKLEGKPGFKAASINSDLYIGEENLNALSDLKSKNELIGEILSLLQSPAKNVLSALLSGKQTIAGLVTALEGRAK